MNVEIRAAEDFEAATITELTLRSKAYWGYSEEFIEACREELSVSPDEIDDKEFHHAVAAIENCIVGYYALKRLSRKRFELRALFVEPAYIGTGIGRALIINAKNHVLSHDGSTIIIQSDPNACHFYQAAGGVLTGEKESGSIPGRYLPVFEINLADKSPLQIL